MDYSVEPFDIILAFTIKEENLLPLSRVNKILLRRIMLSVICTYLTQHIDNE